MPAIPIKITDQERDEALIEFIESNPLPFNVNRHIAGGDFELSLAY